MDIRKLMQQAQKMQQQLQEQLREAEEELAATLIEGSAGGGLVKVTVNGKKQLIKVEISPEAVDPEDVATLEDLVFAAVKSALDQADQKREEIIGAVTQELGLPPTGLPGL